MGCRVLRGRRRPIDPTHRLGASYGPELLAVRRSRLLSAETGRIKHLVRDEGVAGSNPATPTST